MINRSLNPPHALPKEHWALGLMLLFGLIHGLLYVFIVPPWQHYDEPGHFEHAWLIANRNTLPKNGDYDQSMRRELAASMIEHDFFEELSFRPNLISITEPIWIGIQQLSDPHAYYWLVALPLRLVQTTDITFQLYLARIVSLLLYLITIALGYACARELTLPGNLLRWLVPLTMVMVPGFTDIMTAVNNDVGATAFFSAFLWLSIRTIRKGAHWLRFLALIGMAVLCFFTKSTVAFAILLSPIPITLSLLNRGKQRRLAWGIIAFAIGIFLMFAIYPGEPAFWYDADSASNAGRDQAETNHGAFAFKLRASENGGISQLTQLFDANTSTLLSGNTATLSGWAWANQPAQITSPIITSNNQSQSTILQVSKQPQFFSFVVNIEQSPGLLHIILPSTTSTDSPTTVYFDGLSLIPGDWTGHGEPSFTDADGLHGTWGGKSFDNLIRNGSAEFGWIGVRRTIAERFRQFYPGSLATITTSLGDWQGAGWYFETTLNNLFRTFWAKFGWGHVSLVGSKPYRVLVVITVISLIAAVFAAWKYRYTLPRSEIALLLFAGFLVWGAAFFRGIDSLLGARFIPSARYACPAIIPTLAIFCLGWFTIGTWLASKVKFPPFIMCAVYIIFFIALDVLSLWSIVTFYSA